MFYSVFITLGRPKQDILYLKYHLINYAYCVGISACSYSVPPNVFITAQRSVVLH